MSLGKYRQNLSGLERFNPLPNPIRRTLTGNRESPAQTKRQIEKPMRAQTFVAHEANRSRTGQLQQNRIHIGQMIGDQEHPTLARDLFGT